MRERPNGSKAGIQHRSSWVEHNLGAPARALVAVRQAEPADASAVARLLAQLGYDAPADLLVEKLRSIQRATLDAAFVATDDEIVAGCISVHAHELLHTRGRLGRITSLVVDEEFRGAGVGRALIEQAVAFLREVDCCRIEVTSGDHRPAAHAFYEAMDFRRDKPRFLRNL